MKAYILAKKNIPANYNFYSAYSGFHDMGFETIFFSNKEEIESSNREDIIVGYVETVRYKLQRLNIPIIEVNYPPQLNKYLQRTLWKSTINEVASNVDKWPLFVKPVEDKRFTGRVINSTKDLIGCGEYNYNAEVICSTPVHFIAEWRCFVRYGKIIGIKQYTGSYRYSPNYDIIEEAIRQYSASPAGYAADFGLTDDNRTLLVEINDGYALGSYGLNSLLYAKLLSARWAELTDTIDECNF